MLDIKVYFVSKSLTTIFILTQDKLFVVTTTLWLNRNKCPI